jgi:proline iminopeptidase
MISRRLTRASLGLVLGLMVTVAPFAAKRSQSAAGMAPHETRFSRTEVTGVIADARKIVSAKGVEELLEIPVGGTRQWISVRGRNRDNPILLVIHGGPASPEMPTSWWFQGDWEDYFTVVEWDQRGSGKTYDANNPKLIRPTLSLGRIVADAVDVVQYLRSRYGKKKIFVLGHSWGSLVGLQLAHEHPEWLYAYIGMGQVISGRLGEHVGYETTLGIAEATGNAKAVAELNSIAPYPNADGSLPLDKINKERNWSVAFGGLTWERTNLNYYSNLAQFAPEYTEADVAAINKGAQLSLGPLLPYLLSFDYSNVLEWRCPIVIFAGRHDFTTPSTVVAAWFARIHAPAKKFIWFENSAHMIMFEEPGRVLVHLVEDVRPLAMTQTAHR